MAAGRRETSRGKKFTKSDLVEQVFDSTGIAREDVKLVLELLMRNIKDALSGGHIVELRGFGTFEVRLSRGNPRARNPRTGEFVEVKPHGTAYWKPGRELKREVWNVSGPPKPAPAGKMPPVDKPPEAGKAAADSKTAAEGKPESADNAPPKTKTQRPPKTGR
ncbi:MAG: HU family DNA-binding protein [Spirochaetaceae bacterium]|jgi:integration host factor subunit beta|nr:HU family DNA-binding protein [Spirochaetaceae bacterium]